MHPSRNAGGSLRHYIRQPPARRKKFFPNHKLSKMQFKTVVLALTAASAVSAANATNGSNSTNGTSSSSDSGAVQVVGAGIFGVAAAAGVALLI